LALVPTSLLMGFIRLPVDSPRPVALEIRASPVVRCPAAINDSALKGQVSFSDSHMGDAVQSMFARLVPAWQGLH